MPGWLYRVNLRPPKSNQLDPTPQSRVRVTHARWSLTEEALDMLLAAFSPDQDEATRTYLSTYGKLVHFFEWHACTDPESLVDTTFNRVARKIMEGQAIDNLIGFVYGVARLVFMETRREQERSAVPLDDINLKAHAAVPENDTRETRLNCLDRCLEKQPPESRALILDYYNQETPAKDIRKQLAAKLGIPLNALRIRAHRIRLDLEKCVEQCLSQSA